MKKNKGFTLVELLAVIVILAIIMIIAIPAVLQTMQSARQKTFKEYVTKVYTAAQNSYLSEQTLGTSDGKGVSVEVTAGPTGSTKTRTCKGYDVATGLGLSSVGSYTGAVLVCPGSGVNDKINIIVRLEDGNYHMNWYNYTVGAKVGDVTKTGEEGITLENNGVSGGYALSSAIIENAGKKTIAITTVSFE